MNQRFLICLLLFIFLPASLIASEAPLSIADMVKEATQQSAAKHHIELLVDGNARIPSPLQAIEALASPQGITVTSTSKSEFGSFAIRAASLGRGEHREAVLPGEVSIEKDFVRIAHATVIEELNTSAAGVRQDFIVPVAPQGEGELTLELAFTGATLKTKEQAIALTLPGGRELLYHQLNVTDSSGRTLPARFEISNADRLHIVVADSGATYPVRIDPTITDADWVSIAALDTNDNVNALVIDGTHLYVGGNFTTIGGISAKYIAKWNGSSWSALGSGMDGIVISLAWDGSNLFAGGQFYTAGGVSAKHVAQWNGSSWSALGSGMDNFVFALAWDGTNLYAGGVSSHIAQWNGSSWSALGSGMNGTVNALYWDGTKLYAGGVFTVAGGVSANYIAQWNGNSWSALGSGMGYVVSAIVGDGTKLYAGGQFNTAGGVSANRIAQWNGSSWSALGSGMDGNVNALVWDGTKLYAGGQFNTAGGVSAKSIAQWNGSTWSALGSGMNTQVYALAWDGTKLYAGGYFTSAGGVSANRIAQWNGSNWSALGSGMDGNVNALVWDGTKLYAGGLFNTAGGVSAKGIAQWNGSSWSALGSGINGTVNALYWDGTKLYAGGVFSVAGGVSANCIAQWNGSAWSALGSGVNSNVRALAWDGTNLYAGGEFTTAGGVSANRIAQWNGSSWSTLGSGMNSSVYALAWDGMKLYAGGYFTTAGGVSANYIAQWNGNAWSTPGGGMGHNVRSLAWDGTKLYAGGGFTTAGGVSANNVAQWNGSSWSALGNGMNCSVGSLAWDGTKLYAGGCFTTAGGGGANYIAQWNGSNWSALGSGMNSSVNALAWDGTKLYAGGIFTTVGGKASKLAYVQLKHTVMATAGGNGDISPASTTVFPGDTAALTVTHDAGFMIGSIGGCSGTLVGTTYTTSPVTADCTVTVVFIPDTDSDTITDPSDNCPTLANPDQANFDADSMGDICDTDDDNDGIPDTTEIANNTDPFNPDTTVPAVTVTSSLTGLTNQSATTLTYSSNEGTISLTRNGSAITVASGGSLTLVEGLNTIIVTATDAAGNRTSSTITVTRDTTAPITTASVLGGSYTTTKTVTLSSNESATIYYTLNGTTPTTASPVYSGPLNITASTSLKYFARDTAGNSEGVKTQSYTITLSTTPPAPGNSLNVIDSRRGGVVTLNWGSYNPGTTTVATYQLYTSDRPFTTINGMHSAQSYTPPTTTGTITGLADNVPVYVALVPVNASGQFDSNIVPVAVTPTRQGVSGFVKEWVIKYPLNRIKVSSGGYSTYTERDGSFKLTGLPAGSNTLTVGEEGGNLRFNGTTKAVTVNAGQMSNTTVFLFGKTHNLQPNTPASCTAMAGDGKVNLIWTPNTDADLAGYYIYRNGVALNTTPWKEAFYIDQTVTNGETYTYTVKAYSQGGLYSAATTGVIVTPETMTKPPVNLTASLNCDSTVTLSWLAPASSDLDGYNVFQMNGSTMNYDSYDDFQYILNPVTTWTSKPLTAGQTYTFAVRSVGSGGEETNTTVKTTLNVPTSWNAPQASIAIPKAGKRIAGNALHVQAEPATVGCGTAITSSVRFQYRHTSSSDWLDIPAALAQHPNPATGAPYFTKWNVTALDEGDYDLRSVAANSTSTDNSAGFITVTIDHHQPEIAENRSADNTPRAQGAVEKNSSNAVSTGLGSALFPSGSLSSDAILTLVTLPQEERPTGSSNLLANPVDLTLSSGQTTFPTGNEVELGLGYSDANNDGIIDGQGTFAQDTEAATFNPTSGLWEPLPGTTLDTIKKQVKGSTSHFSAFGLSRKPGLPMAAKPVGIYAPASNTTGSYKLSWNIASGAGNVYELQQANDSSFTQNVTTIYTGIRNIFNLSSQPNGSYYYRVRTARPGHQPSEWKAVASGVIVDLTCGNIAGIYAPATNSTGSYKISWNIVNTPGVTYVLTENNSEIYSGPNNYFNVSAKAVGTYNYRVKALKTGYKESAVKGPVTTTIALAVGPISGIYAPATNSTGSYQISWNRSATAGVTYILTENNNLIYSGPNNYFNVTGRTGSNSYKVKATKTNYADSAEKGPITTTVTLAIGNILGIYGPTSSTNGSYKISWNIVNTAGVTYKLYENGNTTTPIYDGTSNSFTVANKGNGTYSYTVQAFATGHAPSAIKGTITTTVDLTCGNIVGIYAPVSNTTGSYKVSWNISNTAGVTYVLEESSNGGVSWIDLYTGVNNYYNVSGKGTAAYLYRVRATKAVPEHIDSAVQGPITVSVSR